MPLKVACVALFDHAAAAAAGLRVRCAGAEPQPGAARGGRQVLHAAGRGRAARDIVSALAFAAGCARSPARAVSLKITAGALLLPCLHAPSQPCVRGRPAAAAGAAGGARAARAGAGARGGHAGIAERAGLGMQAGLDPDPDACTQEDSCSTNASNAACTENTVPTEVCHQVQNAAHCLAEAQQSQQHELLSK